MIHVRSFLATVAMGTLLGAGMLQAAPPQGTAAPKAPALVTTDTGLKYEDMVVGTGATPKPGQRCVVHYTGWLADAWGRKGNKFDSSHDRGKPLTIPIGVGAVIKGWDEGLLGMKVGGKRTLHIPPYLGYGRRGTGDGAIPPNSNLIFEVELLGVE